MSGVKRVLKESYKICSTKNYKQFKFIDGNRDVNHAAKIKKSIEAVGFLMCPILVNEKMEIIDGQGRFTACKDMELPVYYVTQPGLGIEEVRQMNAVSTNWKLAEYIESYATCDRPIKDYIYLNNLRIQFGKCFSIKTISTAVPSGQYKKIMSAGYTCTLEDYQQAIITLDYLKHFMQYVRTLRGRKENMYNALIFCIQDAHVNNKYLLEKFEKYYEGINRIVTIEDALREIQDRVYNHQLRENGKVERVYLLEDYDRYQRAKLSNK